MNQITNSFNYGILSSQNREVLLDKKFVYKKDGVFESLNDLKRGDNNITLNLDEYFIIIKSKTEIAKLELSGEFKTHKLLSPDGYINYVFIKGFMENHKWYLGVKSYDEITEDESIFIKNNDTAFLLSQGNYIVDDMFVSAIKNNDVRLLEYQEGFLSEIFNYNIESSHNEKIKNLRIPKAYIDLVNEYIDGINLCKTDEYIAKVRSLTAVFWKICETINRERDVDLITIEELFNLFIVNIVMINRIGDIFNYFVKNSNDWHYEKIYNEICQSYSLRNFHRTQSYGRIVQRFNDINIKIKEDAEAHKSKRRTKEIENDIYMALKYTVERLLAENIFKRSTLYHLESFLGHEKAISVYNYRTDKWATLKANDVINLSSLLKVTCLDKNSAFIECLNWHDQNSTKDRTRNILNEVKNILFITDAGAEDILLKEKEKEQFFRDIYIFKNCCVRMYTESPNYEYTMFDFVEKSIVNILYNSYIINNHIEFDFDTKIFLDYVRNGYNFIECKTLETFKFMTPLRTQQYLNKPINQEASDYLRAFFTYISITVFNSKFYKNGGRYFAIISGESGTFKSSFKVLLQSIFPSNFINQKTDISEFLKAKFSATELSKTRLLIQDENDKLGLSLEEFKKFSEVGGNYFLAEKKGVQKQQNVLVGTNLLLLKNTSPTVFDSFDNSNALHNRTLLFKFDRAVEFLKDIKEVNDVIYTLKAGESQEKDTYKSLLFMYLALKNMDYFKSISIENLPKINIPNSIQADIDLFSLEKEPVFFTVFFHLYKFSYNKKNIPEKTTLCIPDPYHYKPLKITVESDIILKEVLYEYYECLTRTFAKGGQNSLATNPLISFKKGFINKEQFFSISDIYIKYLKMKDKCLDSGVIYFYGLDIKNFEMLFTSDFKRHPAKLKTEIRNKIFLRVEESIEIKNINANITMS